jgi:hypothetical protein
MRKSLLILILFFLTLISVSAQRVLTGTVTDTSGEPLLGVTISVKNGKATAITDFDGKYSIKIDDPSAVLMFRYMGMEPYQAAVKNQQVLNVTLKEHTTQLTEAVVVSTGYQRLSRERSTAAFGFVDSTKLNRVMHKDILSALEGQVAGLRMDINPSQAKEVSSNTTAQQSDAILFLEQHLDKVESYLKSQQTSGLNAAHYKNLLLRIKKIREKYESGK